MLENKLNQIAAKSGRKSLVLAAKFLQTLRQGLKTKSSNLSVFKVISFKNHFFVEHVELSRFFFVLILILQRPKH